MSWQPKGDRINRRESVLALLALGGWAGPLRAGVQALPEGKVYRIGWLGNSKINTPETARTWDAFRLELQRFGLTEGSNIAFEHRFADGVIERFPKIAEELVNLKVDLIVATSGSAATAAKRATTTIPIVFTTVPDPVEKGLVASLARPGGNLTGLCTLGSELVGKRLELLKEAFPRAKRIA